jgi:hypothetical protein
MTEMFNIDLFYYQNPWHKGKLPDFTYISRDIMPRVLRWLGEKEILAIVGARQAGKSTLLKAIIRFLLEEEKVKGQDIFYFNLDDPRMVEFLSSPEDFIKFIRSLSSRRPYIFIDEAQRLSNAGLFLKYIYDLGLEFKLIITGSSSLELKSKIFETLTGRKIIFYLTPFNFNEFLKTKPVVSELQSPSGWEDLVFQNKLYSKTLNDCLEEYVTYGGYPRVVLEKDFVKKKELLWEIYSSYVQKDVVNFLRIELPDRFNNLVKVLASQIGNLVNLHELSTTLGINRLTTEKYISILEKTFILSSVRPFYRNIRSEVSKMPKVYFNDVGLRNSAISGFGDLSVRPDKGQLIENFVYTQIIASDFLKNVHFWRTKTGGEIDFVAEFGKDIVAVESKFTPFQKAQMPRPLQHFTKIYSPGKVLVFTKDYLHRVEEKGLIYLPAYWIFALRNILGPEVCDKQ